MSTPVLTPTPRHRTAVGPTPRRARIARRGVPPGRAVAGRAYRAARTWIRG